MNWFVALLWLVSGLVLGAGGITYLVAHNVYHYPIRRLEFLRIFAQRWPEDFERALSHSQVVESEWAHACEPIQFGQCSHCNLPWPLDGEKLIRHPSIFHPGHECTGSNTKDYSHVS